MLKLTKDDEKLLEFINGKTPYRIIAREMGTSVGTIRVRLTRLRKKVIMARIFLKDVRPYREALFSKRYKGITA